MDTITFVDLCAIIKSIPIDSDFELMVESCTPQIDQFCKKYNTNLIRIEQTQERGYPEPMFIFSDRTGGYNINGIKNSL